MKKRERIPPLSARHRGVQTSSLAPAALARDANSKGVSTRRQEPQQDVLPVIALKASIGSSTQSYVSGAGYMAAREKCKSFFCRDISSRVLFVPIRDDSEMVVNLELHVTEAGLQRRGVAA